MNPIGLCILADTAGELSPSAPSPRSGEGWGEAAALWIRQQYPCGGNTLPVGARAVRSGWEGLYGRPPFP